MGLVRATAIAASAAVACVGAGSAAWAVTKETKTVNGLKADVFTWKDTAGKSRSVALKKQGSGNPGNGGFAIQMTYQGAGGKVVANAPKGDGFGYFVSHERFRTFADGDSQTIANKIFDGEDDSPLGFKFPVKTKNVETGKKLKSIRFSLTYPRYGTKAAGGINTDTGEDQPPIGTKKKLFEKYELPVTITWIFKDGTDHPRIRIRVSLKKLPGPDRVSFDMRGPYGRLDFDEKKAAVTKVYWGDRFHFQTTSATVTRNSTWAWDTRNTGTRYVAIVGAGGKEMGLFEPQFYFYTQIKDGFAFGRGKTYLTHDAAGSGCPGQELPCDYEWPYQTIQYALPYGDPNASTKAEKVAWGSTPFYGTSVPAVFDGVASSSFVGFPASGTLGYEVCVVLGDTVAGSLTRAASSGGDEAPSCASDIKL